jgi:type I restriction enzyme S subunit
MSSEWSNMPFGNFISLQRGHDLPEQERIKGDVPILGSFGVTGWHNKSLAKAPGLTIGRSGASFGTATYTERDYFPLNTALYVTDFKGNHPKFAYYFAVQFDFSSFNSGSAQPSLNRNFVNPVEVRIPPLAEQKIIAHILGTLDDKIELNRKTNETLEAMAKALFKSWFVDFDPVRAKAEGRPTGLPVEISDLFPDSFEDSELGEIPSGWGVGCLNDCCEITMGQSPPGDTYNEDGEGLPFYQGKTDFGFRFPGRRVYCLSPTRQASIGATLISVRAPVGSANIAREVCSIGRGIAALKSRQSADSFIYYLIGTLQGIFESYNSEGTVFGAINGKDLASIQLVVPSTEAIAAFNSQCLPMDDSIQSNTLETEHLTTIRDTLLPKLISGEIRIPDAEKMLEEVGV